MSPLAYLRSLAATLLRGDKREQELDEELRAHIAQRAEDLAQRGLPRAEAERQARIEFGAAERFKEECREQGAGFRLETLWRDVQFGYRMLRKNPGFTAVVVLTLALGIGANTAIFSWVNAAMLESLPVRNPSQLVVPRWSSHKRPQNIGTSSYGDCGDAGRPKEDSGGCTFSYPMYRQLRAQTTLFSNVSAFAGPAQLDVSGNGPASLARGELVSGDYFQTLGVSTVVGRPLEPEDEKPDAPPVVVLDYGYWRGAFGASPAAIGKVIRLNGVAFTIVGVADPSFTRLTPGKYLDVWLPLTQFGALGLHWGGNKGDTGDERSWWLMIVARLRRDAPLGQAQQAVSLLFRNATLHSDKPFLTEADDPKIALLPAQKALEGFRAEIGKPLYLSLGAVAMVLLIACANVAGLLLARATTRQKEMAVRLALGAGRVRVIQQLLTESLLLSFASAALGVIFAFWGATALKTFIAANSYTSLKLDLRPDATVLLFTAVVATFTAILFGLAPAFRGTRVAVAPVLKQNAVNLSAAAHAGSRRFGLASFLVVCQVALSIVVLISAGLLLRTLGNLRNIDPGFDTRNLLLFSVDPTIAGYKKENTQNLYDEAERRLSALPGVASASYSSDALLAGDSWTSDVKIAGHPSEPPIEVQMLATGPAFFETMRIRLLRGRTLGAADQRSKQPVAVVNQSFVRSFLDSREPIGFRFEQDKHEVEIVGVVADTKYDSLQNANAPTVYIPLSDGDATFELRSAADPNLLIPAVRETMAQLDSNLPIFHIRSQSQTIDQLLFTQRLVARLSSLFAVLALGLTCIGVYGLLAYEVAQRTREFGVRMALGAQRGSVLRLVLGQGLALAVAGVAIGIGAAVGLTRYLQSLLFGVNATDPVTFAAISILLLLVAALACYFPARRATQVDPISALRYE